MDTDHFTFFTPRKKRLAKSFRIGSLSSDGASHDLLPGILVGKQSIKESWQPESILEERWSVMELDSQP
jgi:hypothetical protein